MGENEIPEPDQIREGIAELRRQVAWYRARLQEAADRLALLEGPAEQTDAGMMIEPPSATE